MEKKLTLEDHRLLAKQLYRMRPTLLAVQARLGEAYGYSKPYCGHAGQVIRWLNQLRSELDGCLAQEFPIEFSPSVYYPGKN